MSLLLLFIAALAHADDAPPTGALAGSGAPRLASESIREGGQIGAWAQVQTRITLMDQDVALQADPATYGDPEDDPGFGLSRARLGLDGYLPLGSLARYHQLEWAISLGVAAPYDVRSDGSLGVRLADAFGRWTGDAPIGASSLTVGLQRVPFNRGSLISSADLLFLERDVASASMAPSREVGATLAQAIDLGESSVLLVRGGLFNGNRDIFQNTDPGLLSVARVELAMGDAYRTWSPDLDHALGVGAAFLHNNKVATITHGFAADLLARYRMVTLTAEVLRAIVEPGDTVTLPPDVLERTIRQGFSAQLSFWIPFNEAQGLEIGGRFATYDDATHLDDLGDVHIIHGGLTWRNPLPGIDLGAGYIKRLEPHGEFANDSIRLWTQIRPRFVLN